MVKKNENALPNFYVVSGNSGLTSSPLLLSFFFTLIDSDSFLPFSFQQNFFPLVDRSLNKQDGSFLLFSSLKRDTFFALSDSPEKRVVDQHEEELKGAAKM